MIKLIPLWGLLLSLTLAGPVWAAFPAATSSATTADTDGDTTVVTMPSGITAGDLLIANCDSSVNTDLVQTGGTDWTRIDLADGGTDLGIVTFLKIAEGSDSLTLDGVATEDTACVTSRITGHGVTNVAVDFLKGTPLNESTATPNPPVVTHGGPQDYLVLAVMWSAGNKLTTPYEPTDYTAVNQIASNVDGANVVSVSVASRAISGTSENPGTFTLSAASDVYTQTYSIPPALSFQTKHTDAFTRADNADIGADYDAGYTDQAALKIVSNAVQPTTVNTNSVETLNAVSLADDQWAEITETTISSVAVAAGGVLLRCANPATYTCYLFGPTDATTTVLAEVTTGTEANLAVDNVTVWGAGDAVRGIATGTRLTLQRKPNGSSTWTSLLTAIDGTLTSGKAGLRGIVTTGGALTELVQDDFVAGDFVAPAGDGNCFGLLLLGVGGGC